MADRHSADRLHQYVLASDDSERICENIKCYVEKMEKHWVHLSHNGIWKFNLPLIEIPHGEVGLQLFKKELINDNYRIKQTDDSLLISWRILHNTIVFDLFKKIDADIEKLTHHSVRYRVMDETIGSSTPHYEFLDNCIIFNNDKSDNRIYLFCWDYILEDYD